jgi:hypothetical protein
MHNHVRRTLSAVFAVVCIASAAATHAQCASDDSTKHVYIDVAGCTLLPEQFEVVIGDETVTVTRSADKSHWTGTTESPFTIADRSLTRVELPGFRTSCAVLAKALNDGPCVARYRLQCEPLCRLQVKSTAKRATIEYQRTLITAFGGCEKPTGTVSTPGSLTVGSKETLRVSTTSVTGALVEGTLTFDMFQQKPEWTMFEIANWDRTSISNSPASAALRKMTTTMLFIKQ